MNYSPIKCPNCGSGAIVPAEAGRIYCKSCDQFSEKNETEPIQPELPTFVTLAEEVDYHESWLGAKAFAVSLVFLVVLFMLSTLF